MKDTVRKRGETCERCEKLTNEMSKWQRGKEGGEERKERLRGNEKEMEMKKNRKIKLNERKAK